MDKRPLDDQETFLMPALSALLHTGNAPAVQPISKGNTEPITPVPFLPVDQRGRPYLASQKPWTWGENIHDDTVWQVERLVEQFYSVTGKYPTEICLSGDRYLAVPLCRYRGMIIPCKAFFYPRGKDAKPIKYRCLAGKFGIMVR